MSQKLKNCLLVSLILTGSYIATPESIMRARGRRCCDKLWQVTISAQVELEHRDSGEAWFLQEKSTVILPPSLQKQSD